MLPAPALFQRVMEDLFQGIPNVCIYLDDLLLTGKSEEEHLKTLEAVLEKLSRGGMKLKKEKGMFFAPEVKYLGHKISQQGIEPTEEKVRAIMNAPKPKSVTQLKGIPTKSHTLGMSLTFLLCLMHPGSSFSCLQPFSVISGHDECQSFRNEAESHKMMNLT